MCLGLPGRIVAVAPGSDLVDVDVAGAVRPIHVGLLDGPGTPATGFSSTVASRWSG